MKEVILLSICLFALGAHAEPSNDDLAFTYVEAITADATLDLAMHCYDVGSIPSEYVDFVEDTEMALNTNNCETLSNAINDKGII